MQNPFNGYEVHIIDVKPFENALKNIFSCELSGPETTLIVKQKKNHFVNSQQHIQRLHLQNIQLAL